MKIPEIIHQSWIPHLTPLFDTPAMKHLHDKILIHGTFYPQPENMFRVFKMPLNEIKVVILGADPYPNKGQANGYAFSINPEVQQMTKTLQIIKNEVVSEWNFEFNKENIPPWKIFNGFNRDWQTLFHWIDQGIFLTNCALTCQRGESGSHKEYWEDFMKGVIHIIAKEVKPIWLLWGANAKAMAWEIFEHHEEGRIKGSIENRTMSASHPVNESRKPGHGGFYGCNHFKKVNDLLKENNKTIIHW